MSKDNHVPFSNLRARESGATTAAYSNPAYEAADDEEVVVFQAPPQNERKKRKPRRDELFLKSMKVTRSPPPLNKQPSASTSFIESPGSVVINIDQPSLQDIASVSPRVEENVDQPISPSTSATVHNKTYGSLHGATAENVLHRRLKRGDLTRQRGVGSDEPQQSSEGEDSRNVSASITQLSATTALTVPKTREFTAIEMSPDPYIEPACGKDLKRESKSSLMKYFWRSPTTLPKTHEFTAIEIPPDQEIEPVPETECESSLKRYFWRSSPTIPTTPDFTSIEIPPDQEIEPVAETVPKSRGDGFLNRLFRRSPTTLPKTREFTAIEMSPDQEIGPVPETVPKRQEEGFINRLFRRSPTTIPKSRQSTAIEVSPDDETEPVSKKPSKSIIKRTKREDDEKDEKLIAERRKRFRKLIERCGYVASTLIIIAIGILWYVKETKDYSDKRESTGIEISEKDISQNITLNNCWPLLDNFDFEKFNKATNHSINGSMEDKTKQLEQLMEVASDDQLLEFTNEPHEALVSFSGRHISGNNTGYEEFNQSQCMDLKLKIDKLLKHVSVCASIKFPKSKGLVWNNEVADDLIHPGAVRSVTFNATLMKGNITPFFSWLNEKPYKEWERSTEIDVGNLSEVGIEIVLKYRRICETATDELFNKNCKNVPKKTLVGICVQRDIFGRFQKRPPTIFIGRGETTGMLMMTKRDLSDEKDVRDYNKILSRCNEQLVDLIECSNCWIETTFEVRRRGPPGTITLTQFIPSEPSIEYTHSLVINFPAYLLTISTIISVCGGFCLFSIVEGLFKWNRYKKDGKFLFCLWTSEEEDPETLTQMKISELEDGIIHHQTLIETLTEDQARREDPETLRNAEIDQLKQDVLQHRILIETLTEDLARREVPETLRNAEVFQLRQDIHHLQTLVRTGLGPQLSPTPPIPPQTSPSLMQPPVVLPSSAPDSIEGRIDRAGEQLAQLLAESATLMGSNSSLKGIAGRCEEEASETRKTLHTIAKLLKEDPKVQLPPNFSLGSTFSDAPGSNYVTLDMDGVGGEGGSRQ